MIVDKFKLSREAKLFDSPLYMMKAFLAVLTAYILFSRHTIIGKDMISVLFGMMLSLEPVNISGIKSGLAQFQATILGGLVTAVIIMLAGVNWITVPLAVMMTLYICILLDWRNISPVAFFTSIYMTQYIQFTTAGDPSMFLTLRLRLMALGAGVLVAIGFNFIFSLMFYRSMVKKRTIYLLEKQSSHLKHYYEILVNRDKSDFGQLKDQVTGLFTDIDFIMSHTKDLSKEKGGSRNLSDFVSCIQEIRLINHYFYDLLLESEKDFDLYLETSHMESVKGLGQMMDDLSSLALVAETKWDELTITSTCHNIYQHIERLQEIIKTM